MIGITAFVLFCDLLLIEWNSVDSRMNIITGILKSALKPCGPHRPVLISSFYSVKWLGVTLLPPGLDGMLVHHMVSPSIKFAGTHLYTCENEVS